MDSFGWLELGNLLNKPMNLLMISGTEIERANSKGRMTPWGRWKELQGKYLYILTP